MWDRASLKARGKETFKTYYWKAVVISIILSVVTAASGGSATNRLNSQHHSSQQLSQNMSDPQTSTFLVILIGILGIAVILAVIIQILVKSPLVVGCNSFFVKAAYRQDPEITSVLDGFRNNFKNVVITMFLKNLFISLWSLLLVIPGIVKGYEYMMVPYLLADQPYLTRKEAFAKSKEMMTGNKWNAFVLDLSFIGWYLLGGITCGLGIIFWTAPYVNATKAELYLTLKQNIA